MTVHLIIYLLMSYVTSFAHASPLQWLDGWVSYWLHDDISFPSNAVTAHQLVVHWIVSVLLHKVCPERSLGYTHCNFLGKFLSVTSWYRFPFCLTEYTKKNCSKLQNIIQCLTGKLRKFDVNLVWKCYCFSVDTRPRVSYCNLFWKKHNFY